MHLVALVPADDDPESWGAVAWARRLGIALRVVPIDASHVAPDVAPYETLWCHAGRQAPVLPGEWREALASAVAAGAGVVLSGLAAAMAPDLGAQAERPLIEGPAPWRHADDPLWEASFREWPDYPHVRGAQGWGAHPLFDGLGMGAYTWAATEGELASRCIFRVPDWPRAGVVAVDRAYVRLDATTAVAWEYTVGAGRLLCLGANVAFTASDQRLAAQRSRYVCNALASVAPCRCGERRRYWPDRRAPRGPDGERGGAMPGDPRGAGPNVERTSSATRVVPREAAPETLPALAPAGALPLASLVMQGSVHPAAPFSLASRRSLVVGTEGGGVREVWRYPLCVLSEGITVAVDNAPLTPIEVRITPGTVVRTLLDAQDGRWREVVTAGVDDGVVRCEWAPIHAAPYARVSLSLASRLRLAWPISSDALQPVTARSEQANERWLVHIEGIDPLFTVTLAIDGVDTGEVDTDGRVVQVHVRARAGEALRLAVTASAALEGLVPPGHRLGRTTLAETMEALAARDEARREDTVQLTTPDARVDEAWEWAKARLASSVVHAPGVGTGLVAGYAASRPGWSDARPGYAWFFGRDACWSGDALLAAGLFDEARVAMEFLAGTADVSGKIAHEVSTSGARHYDAADATPLWLRFVARYADWTGDLPTVRAMLDAVHAAVRFVLETSVDGLPRNLGVGHGWIESGTLGGGAVTSYTAALWIDATRRLAPLADRLGARALASTVRLAHTRALDAFDRVLRRADGRVLLHRRADGSPCDDLTALSAVPILLGVDQHPSADAVVRRLAEDDFASPWGVRLLSRHDARYRPRGYHEGAVWPLYSGWAALASFQRGATELGWRHVRTVAECAFHRARGAFDDVLDGETGATAGVCADQAWSAAMLIVPCIDGLLRVQPSAADGRCQLAPAWPDGWGAARVRGLRVGDSRLSLAMTRDRVSARGDRVRYVVSLDDGPPLDVQLAGDGEAVGRLGSGDVVTVERTVTPGATVRAVPGGVDERR